MNRLNFAVAFLWW